MKTGMFYKRLLKSADPEKARVQAYYGTSPDPKNRVLTHTVKLTEVLGELCNEILALQMTQRQEKLTQHNVDTLSDHFSDVFMATLLLAKALDVPVNKAMRDKLRKISKRKR